MSAGASRINVVTSGTEMVIEQIKAQLDRLVPVHRVADLSLEGPHIAREMALIKVVHRGERAPKRCGWRMLSAPVWSMPRPKASCSR